MINRLRISPSRRVTSAHSRATNAKEDGSENLEGAKKIRQIRLHDLAFGHMFVVNYDKPRTILRSVIAVSRLLSAVSMLRVFSPRQQSFHRVRTTREERSWLFYIETPSCLVSNGAHP
jgi:hypothetical protein